MKIKKSILKITSLFLIIGLNYSGLFGVGETMACFNDKEISENNIYTAGTLDFSLHSGQNDFAPETGAGGAEHRNRATRTIQVRQEGNLPFKYTIRTEIIGGDGDFCNALELEAKLEGEIKYPVTAGGENSLINLNFSSVDMAVDPPPGFDTWRFTISAPNNSQNKTCEFKFVFEGWQDNIEDYEENGFDDVEEIENRFSSSGGQNSSWVEVNRPNGGEVWRIGQVRNIQWTTGDFDNCSGKLKIDIWYSADSGASWANIVKNTKNSKYGYDWKVALFLLKEGGGNYLTASAKARIKVVATCSNDFTITAWDMSDEDFCPPIEYDLLTPEEIEILESMGIFNDSNFTKGDNVSDTGEEAENDDEEVLEDVNNKEVENPEDLGLEVGEDEDVNGDVEIDVDDDELDLDENEKEAEEDADADESETEDAVDEDIEDEDATTAYDTEEDKDDEEEEDAKDEEFVLMPKKEILLDDDDDTGDEDVEDDVEELGLDVKEEIEKINNSDINQDDGAENNLNKNSIDCVQAVE